VIRQWRRAAILSVVEQATVIPPPWAPQPRLSSHLLHWGPSALNRDGAHIVVRMGTSPTEREGVEIARSRGKDPPAGTRPAANTNSVVVYL